MESPDSKRPKVQNTKETKESGVSDDQSEIQQMRLDMEQFVRAPHPFGSARQHELATWILERARVTDASVWRQDFSAEVPNPQATSESGAFALTVTRKGANLWAWPTGVARGTSDPVGCVVLLGSHYDTKEIPGMRYVGANDSGSSSVALLHILRKLRSTKQDTGKCTLVTVWFDGEESVLPGWRDGELKHPARIQDNTWGSRFAVSQLQPCTWKNSKARCLGTTQQGVPDGIAGNAVIALVLLDMVGSPGIKLAREANSTPALLSLAVNTAEELGFTDIFEKTLKNVEDDHIPFVRAGIAAVNLIDFSNLDYWHAPGDEIDSLDFSSITKASRIALSTALKISSNPQAFHLPADPR
jgi:glutaminyl-peptide cyclotransferase